MFTVSKRLLFISIFSTVSLLSLAASASKVTVGNGNYSQEGCTNTIENMVGNLPDDYKVTPEINFDDTVWICANLKYDGPEMVDNVERLAADAKDCMDINVDRVKKTVHIRFLPAIRQVVQNVTTRTIYILDGKPVERVEEKSQRAIKFCIIDPSLLEAPYRKFLK